MFLIKIYFLKKNQKSRFHYFTINLTCAKIKYSIKINNKIKYNIKKIKINKAIAPMALGTYCINLVTHLDNHPNLPNIIFATQSRVSECLQSNPMLLHKSPRCHDPFLYCVTVIISIRRPLKHLKSWEGCWKQLSLLPFECLGTYLAAWALDAYLVAWALDTTAWALI